MSNAQTQTEAVTVKTRIYYTKGTAELRASVKSEQDFQRLYARMADIQFSMKESAPKDLAEFNQLYGKVYETALPITQDSELLETLFMQFNDYERSPLSAENNGQWRIREAGVGHTSMSMGDIVVLSNIPYIVRGVGFEALTGFRVE